MIQVTIIRNKKFYRMMKVTGHANSAPYGEDLVCAAVSAVMTGGINALDLQAVKVKNTEGLSEIQITNLQNLENQAVLQVLMTQLQTIANDYPKYIRIQTKEENI
ncbi:MAG: ribosomal-processing cysteine protease Prp [Firmicutes bacterium]|nr:ribosomal-processing cysteine protease Prp [Bacillota bacterium]